jgi:hypothetical protein
VCTFEWGFRPDELPHPHPHPHKPNTHKHTQTPQTQSSPAFLLVLPLTRPEELSQELPHPHKHTHTSTHIKHTQTQQTQSSPAFPLMPPLTRPEELSQELPHPHKHPPTQAHKLNTHKHHKHKAHLRFCWYCRSRDPRSSPRSRHTHTSTHPHTHKPYTANTQSLPAFPLVPPLTRPKELSQKPPPYPTPTDMQLLQGQSRKRDGCQHAHVQQPAGDVGAVGVLCLASCGIQVYEGLGSTRMLTCSSLQVMLVP